MAGFRFAERELLMTFAGFAGLESEGAEREFLMTFAGFAGSELESAERDLFMTAGPFWKVTCPEA